MIVILIMIIMIIIMILIMILKIILEYVLHYYCQKQNVTVKIIEKIISYSNIDIDCEFKPDKSGMTPYNYYEKYHKQLNKEIVDIIKDND